MARFQIPSWVPRWLIQNYRTKYVCSESIGFSHPVYHQAKPFSNGFASLKNGVLVVKRGYAWDGCSYKFKLLGFFIIGTPDGIPFLCPNLLKHASVEHDANCQFAHLTGLHHYDYNTVFYQRMRKLKWPLAALYFKAVQLFATTRKYL